MTTDRPPPWEVDPAPWMRFRLYVAGEVKDETWLNVDGPEVAANFAAVNHRHHDLIVWAERARLPWMTEVYNPAAPEGQQYARVGTDADGMVQPMVVWPTRESPN
jgi:hypothetical protein